MKEGQQYHDECGIPAQKCLKPDAVPMLSFKAHRQKDELKKSDNGCSSTTPSSQGRPCSERRERRLVAKFRDLY